MTKTSIKAFLYILRHYQYQNQALCVFIQQVLIRNSDKHFYAMADNQIN